MTSEPPPFQESARCDVCKCSFSTFRRRHHCRCCGRTLCYEHSSNQMALPQFGIYSSVRVCADCFNNSSSSVKSGPNSSDGVNSVTDSVSKLAIKEQEDLHTVPAADHEHPTSVIECKCGMPLCICEAPAPPADASPIQKNTISTVSVQPQTNPKPKKVNTAPKNRASTSNSRLNSVFNFGQVTEGSTYKPQMEYDVNGEGLREAIKNGDIAAVKKLLSEGVDSNYCDKQGLSLLHLAAVFNQTDIAFMLIDHGARVDYKNAQGETPIDCAPATLQYKMRMKMESQHQGLSHDA